MLQDTPDGQDALEQDLYADAKAMMLQTLRRLNSELDQVIACSKRVADCSERVHFTLLCVENTATGLPTSFRLGMSVGITAAEEHMNSSYGTAVRREIETVRIDEMLLREGWKQLPQELRDAIARNVIAEAEPVLTQNLELHNRYDMVPALLNDLSALYRELVPEAEGEPDV